MKDTYTTPILSRVFVIFGVIALLLAVIAAIFALVESSSVGGISALVQAVIILAIGFGWAVIYFGIAQVIDFLGRTAHSTDRLTTIVETVIVRRIESLEARINSSTPIRVRIDEPKQDKARYHYTANGTQEGPFTGAEMRDFCEAGVLTTSTQVFRDGDSQWRTFKDYPDLHRP